MTESDDHSHSEFKEDKGFRSINECHRSPQHRECGAYCDGEIGLGQDISYIPDGNRLVAVSSSCEASAIRRQGNRPYLMSAFQAAA